MPMLIGGQVKRKALRVPFCVCVLSFQKWGAPVLKLDYLLRDVVEQQRPLDWEGFWTKQATQVIWEFPCFGFCVVLLDPREVVANPARYARVLRV